MKNNIFSKLSTALAKAGAKIKKHSPEILVVTGIVGMVTTTVLACRSTTKVSGILDETKNDIDKVHKCVNDETLSEKYTPEDSRKDLAIIYAQTGIKLIKLYAPSVILGIVSIAAMVLSNRILRKRSVALAAAYMAVDKGFKEYRSRVVEKFGEDTDKELRYNIKAKMLDVISKDENGNEVKAEKEVKVGDPNVYSDYARFFDESCEGWEKDSEYNLYFLKAREAYANDLLRSRGYLFLNEVYDMLGIPRTRAGQIVGWVYDEDNPLGDNYVDFGIYDINREKAIDFVNGYERVILLDFNVDGNILDRI